MIIDSLQRLKNIYSNQMLVLIKGIFNADGDVALKNNPL